MTSSCGGGSHLHLSSPWFLVKAHGHGITGYPEEISQRHGFTLERKKDIKQHQFQENQTKTTVNLLRLLRTFLSLSLSHGPVHVDMYIGEHTGALSLSQLSTPSGLSCCGGDLKEPVNLSVAPG